MPNRTSPQAKAIKSKDKADYREPGTVTKEGQVDVCAVFAPEAESLCNEIFDFIFAWPPGRRPAVNYAFCSAAQRSRPPCKECTKRKLILQ
jgi:hypothetical protein